MSICALTRTPILGGDPIVAVLLRDFSQVALPEAQFFGSSGFDFRHVQNIFDTKDDGYGMPPGLPDDAGKVTDSQILCFHRDAWRAALAASLEPDPSEAVQYGPLPARDLEFVRVARFAGRLSQDILSTSRFQELDVSEQTHRDYKAFLSLLIPHPPPTWLPSVSRSRPSAPVSRHPLPLAAVLKGIIEYQNAEHFFDSPTQIQAFLSEAVREGLLTPEHHPTPQGEQWYKAVVQNLPQCWWAYWPACPPPGPFPDAEPPHPSPTGP